MWAAPDESDERYARRFLARSFGVPFKQVAQEEVDILLSECPVCSWAGGVQVA